MGELSGFAFAFLWTEPIPETGVGIGSITENRRSHGGSEEAIVARVLVEIHVAHVHVKRVWVGDEEYGFWQDVEYENWPAFCSFCERFGHEQHECLKKNPALKPTKQPQRNAPPTKILGRGEDSRETRDRKRPRLERKRRGANAFAAGPWASGGL